MWYTCNITITDQDGEVGGVVDGGVVLDGLHPSTV